MGIRKSKIQKLRKRGRKPLVDTLINVPRFTYEVWKKIFPDMSEEDWRLSMNENDLYTFIDVEREIILDGFYLEKEQAFPKLRIITIDDEYLNWLEQNGEKHSDDSLSRYIDMERTDEEAYRLLKKNGCHKDYIQMGLPVIIFNQKGGRTVSDYKLSKETTEKLRTYLEQVYVGKRVFLSGQLMEVEDYFDEPGMYLNIAKEWFESGQAIKVGKWDAQRHGNKKINVYELVIPFVVCREYKSAVFDYDELVSDIRNFVPEIKLEKSVFDVICSNAEDFTDSEVELEIVKDLCKKDEQAFVEAITWYKDNMLEYQALFREVLEEEKEKSEFKGKIEEC